MTFELPRIVVPNRVEDIPLPHLIACEGYGDLRLIDELLKHHHIANCNVGCPSRDFGHDLGGFVKAIRALLDIRGKVLRGILVVIDADESPAAAFTAACNALAGGGFPVPAKAFNVEELNPRVGVYVMPGNGRDGTLEHLLLDAAYANNVKAEDCVDKFLGCIGKPDKITANQDAKMRMSSLVGATCQENPWSSPAWIWKDKRNPVPINSPCFDPLVDLLKRFSA